MADDLQAGNDAIGARGEANRAGSRVSGRETTGRRMADDRRMEVALELDDSPLSTLQLLDECKRVFPAEPTRRTGCQHRERATSNLQILGRSHDASVPTTNIRSQEQSRGAVSRSRPSRSGSTPGATNGARVVEATEGADSPSISHAGFSFCNRR